MFHYRESQKPDDNFIRRFREKYSDIVSTCRDFDEQNARALTHGPRDQSLAYRYIDTNLFARVKETDKVLRFESDALDYDRGHPSKWFQSPIFETPLMGHDSVYDTSQPQHAPFFQTFRTGGQKTYFQGQMAQFYAPIKELGFISPLSLWSPVTSPGQTSHGGTGHLDLPITHQILQDDLHTEEPASAASGMQHRDSGYETMDDCYTAVSAKGTGMQADPKLRVTTPLVLTKDTGLPCLITQGFRYEVSLKAQTTMVNSSTKTPVTYLNKGQIYTLSIVDSNSPTSSAGPIRYRTYVRISFEDADQRSKPTTCWKLWEEMRGLNKAHERSKLCAVEYVDPQRGNWKHANQHIQVEKVAVDGFCITWTADLASDSFECVIPVRFDFLSTEFSHCKGVKGKPVRLCVKTETLGSRDRTPTFKIEPRIHYCLVQVLRDHGAERKLSNDFAHVEGKIKKLKQQITQATMNGDLGKRKRLNPPNQSTKVMKHRRRRAVDPKDGSSHAFSLRDSLQADLVRMQKMLQSARPISILNQGGDEQDDPTLFPLLLQENGFVKTDYKNRQMIDDPRPTRALTISALSSTSEFVSPSLSHLGMDHLAAAEDTRHPMTVHKIPRTQSDGTENFIKAVEVDPAYEPPAEQPKQQIICFYVRFSGANFSCPYYCSIYLKECTIREFTKEICSKQQIDYGSVKRVFRTTRSGIEVGIDDDVIRKLPQGQDMIAYISFISNDDGVGANVGSWTVEVNLTY